MECEARIDDWSDKELMSRLALVLSLEEGRDEVVEGLDDGGGVDSKLAMILLPFIKVDADDDMEVFVTMDVAMAAATVVAVAAAAAVTLWAALILFCLLQIVIGVDIYFASTRICNELFQLRLQFLNQFLLLSTHGKK